MRLIATDVCVARGGRQVAGPASFALEPGGALVLNGPNGAGKTSLLRALAGLLRLSAGTLDAGDDVPAEQAHWVAHADALKNAMTAGENLAFAAAMLGGRGMTPAAALARLGAAHLERLPAAILSAGQRRRVALARLLVAPRPLWLLDEPLTALDAAGQAVLSVLFDEHRASGGLVIAATHAPLPLPGAVTLTLGTTS